MEFKKRYNSPFMEGKTEKGNCVSFVPVSEDKLIFLDIIESRNQNVKSNTCGQDRNPTKMVIYCSFQVSPPMADQLEKSKILKVVSICNNRKQIEFFPLPFFDYLKLQDVLFDLCHKFNL